MNAAVLPSRPDSDLSRFRGKPLAFALHVASTHKWVYAYSFCTQILWSLTALLPAYLISIVTQKIAQQHPTIEIIGFAMAVIAASCTSKIFDNLSFFADSLREPRVKKAAREILLQYTLGNSYDFFTRNFSGQVASRINQIGGSINAILGNSTWVFNGAIIRIGIVCIVISTISAPIAAIFFLWAFGFIITSYRLILRSQKANVKLSARESLTSGQIQDTLTNFSTLFNLGGKTYEIDRASRLIGKESAITYLAGKREFQMLFARSSWEFFLGIAFVLATTFMVITQGLSIDRIVLIFALWGYCTDIGWVTWACANVVNNYGKAKEQLQGLLEPYTVLESPTAQKIPHATAAIEFKAVTFAYPKGNPIFDNLSIAFQPANHTGIVGRSGSGKSTLVSLILRFYDTTAGSLIINGVEVQQAQTESLRALTAVVPQDPTLFHRTIAENVGFARPGSTQAEIEESCRKAHIHDFITTLPKGYETLVGERGIKLSVGQRQRVAIARAILKDAPLVIFDEATSALDSESEAAIQDAIKTQFKGKTLIVIAHRLSTLKQMDRIIVLDKGQIVQDGAPNVLMNQEGIFKKLWTMQSEGFIVDTLTQVPFEGKE